MHKLIRLSSAAVLVLALGGCGNQSKDDTKSSSTNTESSASSPSASTSPSESPSPAAEVVELYNTRFRGHIDLLSKVRKGDAKGNCRGVGANKDLRKGTPVAIFDQTGAQLTSTKLLRGTIMPLGDDGPQVCRFVFRTDKVKAVGRNYTAKVGDREPAKFVSDDALEIDIRIP